MNKRTTSYPALILYIGTSTVIGAVFDTDKQEKPRISRVYRVRVAYSGEVQHTSVSEEHRIQTQTALEELLKHYAQLKLKKVYVAVSGPWHETHIRTVNSTAKEIKRITRTVVQNTIETYQNEKPPNPGNVDVEAVGVTIKINGYHSALSRTVLGKSIQINLYESEMRSENHAALLTPIQKIFPISDVVFNTFPLAATLALRMLVETTGFITFSVGPHTTDIVVVQDDTIRHHASFPLGYTSIQKSIDPEKESDTMSRLILYARNELSEKEMDTFKEQFINAFSAWHEKLTEVLEKSTEHTPIPRDAYLLTHTEVLPWFAQGIEMYNKRDFALTSVAAPLFQTTLEIGDEGKYDSFVSLLALFFHTAQNETVGKQRVLRVV